MNITIKTIPHTEHRYETAGDWWFDKAGNLEIRVSDMGVWKHEALVAFHELAEALLCLSRDIPQEQVDEFDKEFEQKGGNGEPGVEVDCPYRSEHFFATNVERQLCAALDVDWINYEASIESL